MLINTWNPAINNDDKKDRNALAARGYYNAFNTVVASIDEILTGSNPGEIAKKEYSQWYRELFGPSVTAQLIPATALARFRNDRVFIRNSQHSPPPKEAVMDSMEAFFNCLCHEK